jgi:hypothetical protein
METAEAVTPRMEAYLKTLGRVSKKWFLNYQIKLKLFK